MEHPWVFVHTHFEWVQKSGYPRGRLHYPGPHFTHTHSFTHGFTQSLQIKIVSKALKSTNLANSAHLLNFVCNWVNLSRYGVVPGSNNEWVFALPKLVWVGIDSYPGTNTKILLMGNEYYPYPFGTLKVRELCADLATCENAAWMAKAGGNRAVIMRRIKSIVQCMKS